MRQLSRFSNYAKDIIWGQAGAATEPVLASWDEPERGSEHESRDWPPGIPEVDPPSKNRATKIQ